MGLMVVGGHLVLLLLKAMPPFGGTLRQPGETRQSPVDSGLPRARKRSLTASGFGPDTRSEIAPGERVGLVADGGLALVRHPTREGIVDLPRTGVLITLDPVE
jgi:hypothetical protein